MATRISQRVGSGSSGWQRPYSAKRSFICSTSRLLYPQYQGNGKKLSDHYLNYQHRSNTLTTVSITPYHTNCVQIDGAKRGPHIPLPGVSRPAAQSGILGSICFPPQWLHISCLHSRIYCLVPARDLHTGATVHPRATVHPWVKVHLVSKFSTL